MAHGATAERELLLGLANPLSGLTRVSADFDNDEESQSAWQLHPIVGVALDSRFRLISDTVVQTSTVLNETLSLAPLRPYANGFQWAMGVTGRYEEEWSFGPSVTLLQVDGGEVSGLTVAYRGDLSTLDAFTTWTRSSTALTLRLEGSYDERTDEMLIPVALELRRVFNTSSVGIAVDLRARYFVDVPANAGRWGGGLGLTFSSLR